MWGRVKAWSLKTKIIVGVILLVVVAALAGGGEDTGDRQVAEHEETGLTETESNEDAEPEGPATEVDWENYAPEVKQRIDRMAKKGNCPGLQEEFDVAEANGTAQRNRTGDGNSDLMGYIDEQLRLADCYAD